MDQYFTDALNHDKCPLCGDNNLEIRFPVSSIKGVNLFVVETARFRLSTHSAT